VAATKNSSPGHYNCFQGFPAAYSGVVSVIATNKYEQHASGCGGSYKDGRHYEGVWVSAPGDQIFSLKRNNDYGYLQGANTSWAAPFVSGLAALLSSNPGDKCNLTPGQIKAAIKYGSHDLGTPGWDMKYGQGRVDFWDSLAYYRCT
jgi:subtilisin family serine protease